MASASGVDNLSDEYSDYNCTVCEIHTKQIRAADDYCFECRKYLCAKCLSSHNMFGDGHTVLKTSDKKVQNILTERCEKHPDNVINFICRQHDALLCSVCSFLDHKACKDVKHIGESVDDLTADPDILAIPGHLQSALDHVNQVMEALDKHVKRIRKKEEMYLNGLEQYLTTILSKIEDMRRRGTYDISATHQTLTTKAKENRQACSGIKADLIKYASEIDRTKARQAHLIVLQMKSQAIARKAESLCEESERMIEDTPFSFIFNMTLVEELDKCNSLLVNVKTHKFNIRNPQDSGGCSNILSCCLDDGNILLLDATNKSLKRLDPVSNTVTDVCSFSYFKEVYGVCRVGPQEVAVAGKVAGKMGKYYTGIPCIRFCDVSKGTQTKKIKMDNFISSLVSHSGYLFGGYSGSLLVYNMAGERKQEISKDSSGRSLFSSLESITVNKGGDRIYVADRNMGLICLSRDGQEIFRLTNEQLGLSSATGVTIDHRNQILICGYDSQNIVQVTEKGKVIGEILSEMDGVKNPSCLCFDDVRQKLYVGGDMAHILGFDFM